MTQEQFRNYQEQSFDAFCKKVICNEAINIHKRLAVLAEKEIPLSGIFHSELSALCYEDTYRPYQKTYYVQGRPIRVYDQTIGKVLQFLTPAQRCDSSVLLFGLQRHRHCQTAEDQYSRCQRP